MRLVGEDLKDVFNFFKHIPIFQSLEKGENVFYSFIDDETLNELYLYSFYSMLEYFIQTIDNEDLIIQFTNIDKNSRREQIAENRNPSNTIESTNNNVNEENLDHVEMLDEVQIYTGQKKS